MASRPHGPICSASLGSDWIDSGTLVQTRSSPPSATGVTPDQAAKTIVIPGDVPHRLLAAARCGLPYFKPEIREKIRGFLTIENFLILAALIAADMAFAGTGVGTAVNVFAGGVMVALVGLDMVTGTRHLIAYYKAASMARSAEQLQAAGAEFAKGVTTIGVDSLLVLLARRSQTRVSGATAEPVPPPDLQANWFAFIDSIEFDVPRNKGVIWAGLPDASVARSLALKGDPDAVLLNDILDEYGFGKLVERDFGKDNTAETYRIWERASMRYVSSLQGLVTAYVDSTKMKAGSLGELTVPRLRGLGLDGQYSEGILGEGKGAGGDVESSGGTRTPSVIITEIEELIDGNPNITGVVMKDAKTGKTLGTYTPRMRSALKN